MRARIAALSVTLTVIISTSLSSPLGHAKEVKAVLSLACIFGDWAILFYSIGAYIIFLRKK